MKQPLIGLILLLTLSAQLRSTDFQIIPYHNPLANEEAAQLRETTEKNIAKLTPPPFSCINKVFIRTNFTGNYSSFNLPQSIFVEPLFRVKENRTIKEAVYFTPLQERIHPAFPVLVFTPWFDDVINSTYLMLAVNYGNSPVKMEEPHDEANKQTVGFLIYNALPEFVNHWPEQNKNNSLNPLFNLIQENVDIMNFQENKRIIRCCQHYPQLHISYYYTLGFMQALCAALQDEKELAYFVDLCRQNCWVKAKLLISNYINRNFPSYLLEANKG